MWLKWKTNAEDHLAEMAIDWPLLFIDGFLQRSRLLCAHTQVCSIQTVTRETVRGRRLSGVSCRSEKADRLQMAVVQLGRLKSSGKMEIVGSICKKGEKVVKIW